MKDDPGCKDEIRLSEKHGVNPSLMQCFFCLEDVGVALVGRLPDDRQAPRRCVWNRDPCDKCKKLMKKGIILISIANGEKEQSEQCTAGPPYSPYRTGGWCVVKERVIREIVTPPELLEQILEARFAFVPDEAWDAMGLPRHEIPEQEEE